jgi:hypothetical protein
MRNSEDFRTMCDKARKAALDYSEALLFAAKVVLTKLKRHEDIQAHLRQVQATAAGKTKREVWQAGRKDYGRARRVAAVFTKASKRSREMARAVDKGYGVFLKHYGSDIQTQIKDADVAEAQKRGRAEAEQRAEAERMRQQARAQRRASR